MDGWMNEQMDEWMDEWTLSPVLPTPIKETYPICRFMPLFVMNSATTAWLCPLKILGLPGTHPQLPGEPGSQTFTEDTCRAPWCWDLLLDTALRWWHFSYWPADYTAWAFPHHLPWSMRSKQRWVRSGLLKLFRSTVLWVHHQSISQPRHFLGRGTLIPWVETGMTTPSFLSSAGSNENLLAFSEHWPPAHMAPLCSLAMESYCLVI